MIVVLYAAVQLLVAGAHLHRVPAYTAWMLGANRRAVAGAQPRRVIFLQAGSAGAWRGALRPRSGEGPCARIRAKGVAVVCYLGLK